MPLPLVVGICVMLVAGFVPFIVITGALPERLPETSMDASASEAAHRRAARRAIPAYVDRALRELGDASARRDAAATAAATRAFADALVEAAGDDDQARAAIREAQCDQFLARAATGSPDGFARTAARHGVIALGRALTPRERAIARAWFAFRWEALGARAALRGERLSLDHALSKLLPQDARTLLAWVLSSDCASLLGLREDELAARAQVERCSAARRDFVVIAANASREYPRAEALAAVDALEGRALAAIARRSPDAAVRAALATAARESFARAHGRYTDLAVASDSRKIKRFMLGAMQASQQ